MCRHDIVYLISLAPTASLLSCLSLSLWTCKMFLSISSCRSGRRASLIARLSFRAILAARRPYWANKTNQSDGQSVIHISSLSTTEFVLTFLILIIIPIENWTITWITIIITRGVERASVLFVLHCTWQRDTKSNRASAEKEREQFKPGSQ